MCVAVLLASMILAVAPTPPHTAAFVTSAISHDKSPVLSQLGAIRQTIPEHANHFWDDEIDGDSQQRLVAVHRVVNDPALQTWLGAAVAPAPIIQFPGLTQNVSPPDANGAVGPYHYVQTTNGEFAVYSKAGTLLLGPVSDFTLWQGFAGECAARTMGDPIVLYDGLADRWVLSRMGGTAPPYTGSAPGSGRACIAVSQTGDPTGSWYRYEFSYPTLTDATKLAVWPSAYVLTTIILGPYSFAVCALDRARMLAGEAADQQCFSLSTGVQMPVHLGGGPPPPSTSPAYFVDLSAYPTSLGLYRLNVDWDEPSNSQLSQRIPIPVAPLATTCFECVTQPGTSQKLQTLDLFIMNHVVYRNIGDHESIVLNHSTDLQGVTGIRWYELRLTPNGSATLFQQGTFAPDSNHRWNAASAVDANGDIAIGYSVASSALYPSIRYSGRLVTDPLGVLTVSEGSLYEGTLAQTSSDRWGDYASMELDPIDGCTFWFTTEFAGLGHPRTQIAAFRFPGCGSPDRFSLELAPNDITVTGGKSASAQLLSKVVSGDPRTIKLRVDGLPRGVSATFDATAVAIGAPVEVKLNADVTAALGEGTFSILGTSSSAQSGVLGKIRVIATSPPSTGCDSSGLDGPGVILALLFRFILRPRRSAGNRGSSVCRK